MFILSSVKPSVFSGMLSSLFTLIICALVIVRANMPGSGPAYYRFATIFSGISFVPVTLVLFYWGFKWAKNTSRISVEDYSCLLYVFIYFICTLGSYANMIYSLTKHGKVSDFSTYTAEGLAASNYLYVFVFIMLTIAPGRIARFEAVTHLVS